MPLVSLRLPLPPSANRYWRSAPGRGLVRSKEADLYIEQIAVFCRIQGIRPIRGKYRITITAYGLRADADLGNVEKILSDALEGHAFLNDRDARRIVLEWGECEPKEQFVNVRIEGEVLATAAEVEAARAAKSERNRKRKKTLAQNRLNKALAARGWGLKPAVQR